MSAKNSIPKDVAAELSGYFRPPRLFLQALAINGLISLLFFLFSYYFGAYNTKLLPVAAGTIVLWTLADVSITNQLVFDRPKAVSQLKTDGTIKRLLLTKNLAIVVLSVPLMLLFGLVLAGIVGKWSEILYGAMLAFTLVWGWLGVSNALSAVLPFELLDLKGFLGNRRIWLRYSLLYGLPWVLLPLYALAMSLPFVLLGWTYVSAAQSHRATAVALILAMSLTIWWFGLLIAEKYTAHPKSRIKKLML